MALFLPNIETPSPEQSEHLKLNLETSGYTTIASFTSTGITGFGTKQVKYLSSIVDNTGYGYSIFAKWDTGDDDLKLIGAVITYSIDEAL